MHLPGSIVMVIMLITMQKSAFFMKTSRDENLEISEKLCLCVLLLVLFVAKRCRLYCLGTDERKEKKKINNNLKFNLCGCTESHY